MKNWSRPELRLSRVVIELKWIHSIPDFVRHNETWTKRSIYTKNYLLKKLAVSHTSKLVAYMKALEHKEIILQIKR